MKFKTFVEFVKEEVEKELGADYTVEVIETRKNKDQLLTGLRINLRNSNVSPVVYLEDYYTDCLIGGETIESIVSSIVSSVRSSQVPDIDLSYICDYEKVKDKLLCKLVNYEKKQGVFKEYRIYTVS